jgi:uncharacterized protein (TIGR00369 family)
MTIDRAGEADVPELLALQRTAFASEAALYGDDAVPPLAETDAAMRADLGGAVFLKAVEGGRIVGAVRGRRAGLSCQVARLAVHPAARRRGVGTALVGAIEAAFGDAVRYELFSGARSEENLRLYRRLGYAELRRERVSEALTLVFMEKPGAAARARGAVAFAAADPAFEARVRRSFARQAMMATLGARLERVAPGEVDIRLPYRAELTQQHGFLHAGAIATVADSAAGYAALTLMAPGAAVLTAEFKVNLMAPGKGESVVARGRVVKPGRTLTTCAADVFATERGAEKLVLTLLATAMTVQGRGIED